MVNINKIVIATLALTSLVQAAAVSKASDAENELIKQMGSLSLESQVTVRTEKFCELLDLYEQKKEKEALALANIVFSFGIINTRTDKAQSTPIYKLANLFQIDLMEKMLGQGRISPEDEGQDDEVLQIFLERYINIPAEDNLIKRAESLINKLVELGYSCLGLSADAESLLKQHKITKATFELILSKDELISDYNDNRAALGADLTW